MMNANMTRRLYDNFMSVSRQGRHGVLLAVGLATLGASGVAHADEDEPLSALGVETGLELYDRDADDACVPGSMQIRVTVKNVNEEGILKLELFGEKDFMRSSGKLRRIRVPAKNGPMRVCINVPQPGDYAVVGYHDQDGDRKLDKKWNFKPKEPYGLSNNPKIESLRLPKWEETHFSVPMSGTDILIELVDLG